MKKKTSKRNGKRKKKERQLKEETWNFSNFMKGLQKNINLQNIGDGVGARCQQFGGIVQQRWHQ